MCSNTLSGQTQSSAAEETQQVTVRPQPQDEVQVQ